MPSASKGRPSIKARTPQVGAEPAELSAAAVQVDAVLARAHATGLTAGKTGRIAGRVSPRLIERAKAKTGLRSDTALIEFALANLAVEDTFAETFQAIRGTVDPDLDLEV